MAAQRNRETGWIDVYGRIKSLLYAAALGAVIALKWPVTTWQFWAVSVSCIVGVNLLAELIATWASRNRGQ